MILEKNFIQMQYDAKEKYINVSAKNFANEGEKLVASNAYIQGRVDAVADMESLVGKYNQMLKERNKLAAELADIKAPKTRIVSPPVSGPKKGKEGYVQHIIDAAAEELGL